MNPVRIILTKRVFFVLYLLLTVYSLLSGNNIDSLKNIITELPQNEKEQKIDEILPDLSEKEKMLFFNEIAKMYLFSQPDLSFDYAKKALNLAQELDNDKEEAKAYTRFAQLYFSPKLKYDSAEYFVKRALRILEKDSICNTLGLAYNYAGIIQADQGNLEEGLKYFEKAEKVFTDLGNYCKAANIHHNIGKLNKYSKSSKEVEKYFREALEMYKKYNCEENYDFLYDNLAEIYIEKKEYDKAKESALKSFEISKKYNKEEGIGVSYLLLGEINMHLDTSAVLPNYFKALSVADSFGIVKLQTALYLDLADYFQMKKDFDKTIDYLNKALTKAKSSKKLFYIQKSYKKLSDVYKEKRNYKKAYKYYELYDVYKDSINAEKVRLEIAAFENDKKEDKIRLLDKENKIIELKAKRSKTLFYFSIVIIVLILALFYFLFQNYKHKQNIQKVQLLRQSEQKLLEMEKKILSSVIETEDKERKRFAMDLHDGLGPLLSGIKLYAGELQYLSGTEKEETIEEIKRLINQAIQDIRSISRNILPESFSEKGLIKSLEAFISKIKTKKDIEIKFVDKSKKNVFNKGIEIIVYRIVTELINNALKHSDAKIISIEFLTKNNQFAILYKDNGKGFDVQKAMQDAKGMGLKNIRERINTIGGSMKIYSDIGQGVEIEMRMDI